MLRLRGYLPEEAKRAVVAGARLHLNTSQGEGWGLCVLEAAALGVPTVAYDVDGLRDAVRDGETGWLVRAGESLDDVTERALKELSDPGRRAEIAAACRAWAAQLTGRIPRRGWPRWSARRSARARRRGGTGRRGSCRYPGAATCWPRARCSMSCSGTLRKPPWPGPPLESERLLGRPAGAP